MFFKTLKLKIMNKRFFIFLISYALAMIPWNSSASDIVGYSGLFTFDTRSYELNLATNPEGAGATSGEGNYLEGKAVSVSVIPEDGFNFDNWADDSGNVVSNQAAFEFTMPGMDVLLTANFEAYSVNFQVTALNGNPVADAWVFLGGAVNPAGNYLFVVIPGQYDYVVHHSNYLNVSGQLTVADGDVTENVVLEAKPYQSLSIDLEIDQPNIEDCFVLPGFFSVSGGGDYCVVNLPSGVSVILDGSQELVNYQLYRDNSAYGALQVGTGDTIIWNDLTFGAYTVEATNGYHYILMNGEAFVSEIPALPVSIVLSADASNVCDGTEVFFEAMAINGGANPFYQWQVNGVNEGTNDPYFLYLPQDNDQVKVILTSSEECTIENPVTSNVITMIVNPLLPVDVTIYGSKRWRQSFLPMAGEWGKCRVERSIFLLFPAR